MGLGMGLGFAHTQLNSTIYPYLLLSPHPRHPASRIPHPASPIPVGEMDMDMDMDIDMDMDMGIDIQ
jgi:hypothetical protein